jgi:hypothetical protein
MTRLGMLSALIWSPVACIGLMRASTRENSRCENHGEKVIVLGPGNYSIAPGGEVGIVAAASVSIRNCTFTLLSG